MKGVDIMLSSAMKARFFQERFMNSSITKITDLSAPQIEKILAAAFKYKKEKGKDGRDIFIRIKTSEDP